MERMKNNLLTLFIFMCLNVLHTSCKKYLDKKPNQNLLIPSRLEELQGLLDNDQLISQRSPKAAEMSADDYYLTDNDWRGLDGFDKGLYTWNKSNLFPRGTTNDWANAYVNVYYANIVLAYIDKIYRKPGDQEEWNSVKGQALFIRGQAFGQIVSIWAVAYDENTASKDQGIPLKLDPDFNVKANRATLKQTYDQIISDLKNAAALLPVASKHMLRASKTGAYALLARIYLFMRDYNNMGTYANLSLQLKNTLKDYNTLNPDPLVPFPFAPRFSNEEEIIIESNMQTAPVLHFSRAKIDSILYRSYSENDLRKRLFFRNNTTDAFRGNYSGSDLLFSGVATDEVYLMRAESYARAGNASAASTDLNKLLEKRYVAGTFMPLTTNSAAEVLSRILAERRKELVMRGLRWMDIKRLNKEGANIILKRIIAGQTYVLPPNDPRYALPIPEDVIDISGMVQNPR